MATYRELRALFNNDELRNLTEVAIIIAAEAIRTEDAGTANHANRLLWAKAAFRNPTALAVEMLMALLAANKAATVAQILAVDDASMQTLVNNAVNVFADGA